MAFDLIDAQLTELNDDLCDLSSDTCTETETTSCASSETNTVSSALSEQSVSPKQHHNKGLSIDMVTFLQPIMSDDEVIAKAESESEKETKEEQNGFPKLFALYALNETIHEKQIKDLCLHQIKDLLSNKIKNSEEMAIICDFDAMKNEILSDITVHIFCESNHAELVHDFIFFGMWNIGLLILFMLIGKERATHHYKDRLNDFDNIRSFLVDLYMKHKISTNCFDLLYFYMLIFGKKDETESRFKQIEHHLWFEQL